jgi:peptidoglycan/xylan/chitin deacetylase (PgdA/CDA1 family)
MLAERGLPACFYLTAGYLGTARQFPWDVERGVTTRMMSWAQAREMAGLGFEIGCHTWSHPDLGSEPIASAPRELGDARARLEDELGVAVEHFAYPFGGKANISAEWIDAVRATGLTSNACCHGGVVRAGDDPYWIPRQGAHQRTLTELRIELDDAW